ncbi:MAG: hypothetical protein Ct9H90mP1_1530 [Methanobacteriota archaeon]|nr:MAG: hypothetical protein Ct9H90mP1_1530 [Euryarchaeota archaeon]
MEIPGCYLTIVDPVLIESGLQSSGTARQFEWDRFILGLEPREEAFVYTYRRNI